jgi:hypothetical protein
LAELRFRAFREESIRELTASRPAGEPNVGVSEPVDHPESTLPIMDDYRALDVEAEEHTGLEMDSEQFLQDRIEDVGRLTADQTASIIAAVPDAIVGGVAESVAESVVQKALNQQVRNPKLLRVELDSMVGTVGRQYTEAWKHVQEIHYALEFGPKWGPGAAGKGRGKRVTQADDDSDADEVQVRTKVYEKKKPRVVQDGSVLGKKETKWTASIDQTSKPALPLQEKTPNRRLAGEPIGTPQNQQVDYDLSVIDPLLR